ncbi:NADH-quinone oxidoreductase subunit N [Desulfonatronum thiosulfatophilum]|uniref:NADH-quinone oxidoreductase subunit N n=1 Tax=Desulfonatronum thiosulfatophilum TaxID=617002 RepID=A0A1G6CYW6_9BACT|nr:NADH-quinone oxidoreductase subunit N [Desulfonatronum thiosulfatophilum]
MLNFTPSLIIPELYMVVLLIVLFVQTVTDKIKDRTDWLAYASLGGVLIAALSMEQSGMMFYDSYQIDGLSQFFKLIVVLGLAICVLNALRNNSLGKTNRADYFFFMFMSAFGLMLLASTVELFTLYISLELASYSLYILLPLRNDNPQAVEGAIKYALFGAVATAIGLFGVSYIIAGQHTTYLHELATMNWSFAEQPMALVGLGLFSLAFLYKLALFPFHFWAPDVYQGANNETAAFAATLPKVGAIVVLVRLMSLEPGVEIKIILAIFATLSMTLGNLLALRQTDLKRLLAYSSVAHAGFVVMGLVAGGMYGLAAASYYALVYVVMNLTIFWVITRISDDGRNIQLHDLKGLHRSSPLLAFVLAVAAFGLVGLPPTGGFTGKLFLLNAAWGEGFYLLVIIAALNTALAIFYYLNMVRHAYTMDQDSPRSIQGTMIGATVALALALGVLFLGLMPQGLFDLLLRASNALLL